MHANDNRRQLPRDPQQALADMRDYYSPRCKMFHKFIARQRDAIIADLMTGLSPEDAVHLALERLAA